MSTEEIASKRRRFTSSFVTLKVGEQQEVFNVYEDTIKASSAFFRAALDGQWKEGKTREIALPEDKTDVVTVYLVWLYDGKLDMYYFDNGNVKWALYFDAYVFAEKVQDDAFADAVMTILLQALDQRPMLTPNGWAIQRAYAGTTESSPLRRLLVVAYADRCDEAWFINNGEYSAEFLLDVVKEFTARRGPSKMKLKYAQREEWFKQKKGESGRT